MGRALGASGGMADAHGSGPCVRKDVRVQLPPRPLDQLGSPYPGSARGLVISPMPLWGATPTPRPAGLRPPDPLWGFAPRPPAGYFGSRSLGLRPLPPAGYLGTRSLGLPSLPLLVILGPTLWGFCLGVLSGGSGLGPGWSPLVLLLGASLWVLLLDFGFWGAVVTFGTRVSAGHVGMDALGVRSLPPPVTVGAGVSFLLVTSGTNFHTPWLPLGRGQGHGLALPRGSWTGWPRVGQPAGRD